MCTDCEFGEIKMTDIPGVWQATTDQKSRRSVSQSDDWERGYLTVFLEQIAQLGNHLVNNTFCHRIEGKCRDDDAM
jgi:hypothetical protein